MAGHTSGDGRMKYLLLSFMLVTSSTLLANSHTPPLLSFSAAVVPADAVRLSWNDPNCDTVTFRVAYGNTPGAYTEKFVVEPTFIGGRFFMLIENLPDGDYYFVVTADNIAGGESADSNEVSRTINTALDCYGCHQQFLQHKEIRP